MDYVCELLDDLKWWEIRSWCMEIESGTTNEERATRNRAEAKKNLPTTMAQLYCGLIIINVRLPVLPRSHFGYGLDWMVSNRALYPIRRACFQTTSNGDGCFGFSPAFHLRKLRQFVISMLDIQPPTQWELYGIEGTTAAPVTCVFGGICVACESRSHAVQAIPVNPYYILLPSIATNWPPPPLPLSQISMRLFNYMDTNNRVFILANQLGILPHNLCSLWFRY